MSPTPIDACPALPDAYVRAGQLPTWHWMRSSGASRSTPKNTDMLFYLARAQRASRAGRQAGSRYREAMRLDPTTATVSWARQARPQRRTRGGGGSAPRPRCSSRIPTTPMRSCRGHQRAAPRPDGRRPTVSGAGARPRGTTLSTSTSRSASSTSAKGASPRRGGTFERAVQVDPARRRKSRCGSRVRRGVADADRTHSRARLRVLAGDGALCPAERDPVRIGAVPRAATRAGRRGVRGLAPVDLGDGARRRGRWTGALASRAATPPSARSLRAGSSSALLAFAAPSLSALEPSTLAIALSLAALVPPVWLALLDLRRPGNGHGPTPADAGALGGLFRLRRCGAHRQRDPHGAHAAAASSRRRRRGSSVLGRSAGLHLVVFSAVFALTSIVRGAARLAPRPDAVEAWLARTLVAAMLGLFIHRSCCRRCR